MCRKTSKKCIWFFKDMSYLHTCSQESLINSCKLTVCHLIRWWGGCQCVRGTYWFEASVDETAQRVHRGPSGRKRRLHVWPARNCQLARCVELMSTTCTEFDFFPHLNCFKKQHCNQTSFTPCGEHAADSITSLHFGGSGPSKKVTELHELQSTDIILHKIVKISHTVW